MQVVSFIKRYTSHISTIIFVGGFFFDSFTLPEIDTPLAKYLGFLYIAVLSVTFFIREYIVSRNTASKIEQQAYALFSFIIAFFSGALLSFIFVYYFRSADLSVSWPFFLLLILIMISNEFVSSHSFRFLLDIGIFITSILFFFVFNMPIFLKEVSDQVFMISLGIGTLYSLIFVYLLRYASEIAEEYMRKMQALAIVLPLSIAFLYFSSLIPAVPLSLKDAGIYHFVKRNPDGEYTLLEKETTSFPYFHNRVFHYKTSDTGAYFYSAVHAPAQIEAPISHVWEKYDATRKTWVRMLTIPIGLTGGRESGYRAYSYKEGIEEGLWRVVVKAGDTRIIGRITFVVEKS